MTVFSRLFTAMQHNRARYQPILRVFQRLSWQHILTGLCGLVVCAALGVYIDRPRHIAHHLLDAMQQQHFDRLPTPLKLDLQQALMRANGHATDRPAWQGAGGDYLRNIWPTLAQQQQPEQLLLLQLSQFTAQQRMGYRDFPDVYVLQIGEINPIDFEFQRQGWFGWQLSAICTAQPQPALTLKRCPSPSR